MRRGFDARDRRVLARALARRGPGHVNGPSVDEAIAELEAFVARAGGARVARSVRQLPDLRHTLAVQMARTHKQLERIRALCEQLSGPAHQAFPHDLDTLDRLRWFTVELGAFLAMWRRPGPGTPPKLRRTLIVRELAHVCQSWGIVPTAARGGVLSQLCAVIIPACGESWPIDPQRLLQAALRAFGPVQKPHGKTADSATL